MAQTESLHVRIPQEIREELDRIATTMDRSRNWVVTEAIEQYLEVQRWQIDLIRERLAEAESGTATFIPHEEVMERHEKRLREKLGV
jgi:predicted transcriptional regulator